MRIRAGLPLLLCVCAVVAHAVDYSGLCPYREQKDLPSPGELATILAGGGSVDLRSCDLSQMDLSTYPSNFADYADFDSKTRWPEKTKMPKGFIPQRILREGVNPGLGVRALHARGITGRGVGLAIIDQPLLTGHQEYARRLKFYENQDATTWEESMHGAAVASIAVGQTVGVAPEADLYYISAEFRMDKKSRIFNALPVSKALNKIYQINENLPDTKKIRVVSISRGFSEEDAGAEDFEEAKARLEAAGVAVFSTDSSLFTLSRACSSCPADDNASYTRGAYWFSEQDLAHYGQMDYVLFPTDYRVTAAPNGNGDYVSYVNGGLSWAVPYAAGLYALAAQVYPPLTPELFWQTARETAVAATVKTPQGKTYSAKYLVQPQRLIKKLQNMKQ